MAWEQRKSTSGVRLYELTAAKSGYDFCGQRPITKIGTPSLSRNQIDQRRTADNGAMVPQEGLEPPTPSLRMTCSTN